MMGRSFNSYMVASKRSKTGQDTSHDSVQRSTNCKRALKDTVLKNVATISLVYEMYESYVRCLVTSVTLAHSRSHPNLHE